jgi:polyphosphate kinase
MMLDATDSNDAPWYVIRSDDKRRARLNCITHILETIPHKATRNEKVKLPKRIEKNRYDDQHPMQGRRYVREVY